MDAIEQEFEEIEDELSNLGSMDNHKRRNKRGTDKKEGKADKDDSAKNKKMKDEGSETLPQDQKDYL